MRVRGTISNFGGGVWSAEEEWEGGVTSGSNDCLCAVIILRSIESGMQKFG